MAIMISSEFISYYPLKQGLKPTVIMGSSERHIIYILLSIKTRIETASLRPRKRSLARRFISYYPLKQGLKRGAFFNGVPNQPCIYILLSIKTRIETPFSWVLR